MVTEKIFGKELQGCWVAKGKKGVFDFEEYEDTAVEEKEILHDSRDAPFSEEALGRKRKAVMNDFGEASQAREKCSVQGQEMSLDGVLALLQASGHVAPEPEKRRGADEGEEQVVASSDSSPDGSSDEEPAHSSFFGSAPKPKSAAKPAAKPVAKPTPASSKVEALPPKKKTEKKGDVKKKEEEPKPSLGKNESSATMLADCRAQRALRNLQESVSKWEGELAGVDVDDDPPAADAASQSAFRQECVRRLAVVKTIARNTRDYSKRMDKSANEDFFATDLDQLQALETAACALQTLLQVFLQTTLRLMLWSQHMKRPKSM